MPKTYSEVAKIRIIILICYFFGFVFLSAMFLVLDLNFGYIGLFVLLYIVIQYFNMTLVMNYQCINCEKVFFSASGLPLFSSHCRHCDFDQLQL